VSGALPGQTYLGDTDADLRRYLAKGVEAWTIQLGTDDHDEGLAMATEGTGAYVVGTSHGTLDGQTNTSDRDAYIVRLRFT